MIFRSGKSEGLRLYAATFRNWQFQNNVWTEYLQILFWLNGSIFRGDWGFLKKEIKTHLIARRSPLNTIIIIFFHLRIYSLWTTYSTGTHTERFDGRRAQYNHVGHARMRSSSHLSDDVSWVDWPHARPPVWFFSANENSRVWRTYTRVCSDSIRWWRVRAINMRSPYCFSDTRCSMEKIEKKREKSLIGP
jgi:hypothetical protein